MTASSEAATPGAAAGTPGSRAGFLFAAALVAALLVVSARQEPVVEQERLGQRVEIMELIAQEQARAAALSERVSELQAQVATLELSASGGTGAVEALEEKVAAIAAPAGMTEIDGPGVHTVLSDSTLSAAPSGDLNDLVIHEQDLQAVINALWAGGAEAMSVNGQRILATTAIRCVGNTLLLHGTVYSPPYVIEAIGDGAELTAALDRDPMVTRFRAAAKEHQLGFTVEVRTDLLLPAYEGSSQLRVARPSGAEG